MKPKLILSLLWLAALSPAWAHPEAFEIGEERTADLPKGKEADGIIGDFVLRNDHVQALISGNLPLRRANMSTFYGTNGITPGCLYDLTLANEANDQIVIFSPCEQRGPVSWVRVVEGDPGVVETVVTAPSNGGIFRRHEYRVDEDASGVLITTTLRNESKAVRKEKVADRWTNFPRTGNFSGFRWADAVDPADRAGYAYLPWKPADAEKAPDELEIPPGQEITVTRFLAVGHSPAEALGLAARYRGGTGTLKGRCHDAAGRPATATIRLQSGDASVPAYTDAEGRFDFPFPPGSYRLVVEDLGRATVQKEIELAEGATLELDFELAPRSTISFEITDGEGRDIPCKAQFLGIDGTPTPNLGPPNRAHGCKDQYHSETGRFSVALNPGTYRVVVTRGIEYGHLSRTVRVLPGQSLAYKGQLPRLVDTRGWVSVDYHNHSTPSGDNTCGTDDRIINLAAEHIEFAPTTEHNRHYDWRPHIEKLGLASEINTVSGIELTGSGPHFNSFPFHPHPHRQDNGAPVWNRDPRITAVLLRNHQTPDPDRWIQINHPDLVENFIDSNGDGLADGGYIGLGLLIDGLETQNFTGPFDLPRVPVTIYNDKVYPNREFVWLQLLNQGHRLIAMAVADAHSVHGNGVGGWRMYMPSASDAPAQIDWRENSKHAKAGRSYLTTGPFLQVTTAEGAGPGAELRASGEVKLNVKVQCTDWIDIDRVQVLVNGRPLPSLNFTRQANPDMFNNGVVKFDRQIRVPLAADAHLIVVAMGENSNLSVGYGTSDQAKLRPCAYHNPIYVDVDGGGFKSNYDTLGHPLGVPYTLEQAKAMLLERQK